MTRIRMFASDVDGTILPRGGVLSARTKAAVRRAEDSGCPFVVSSGRWYVSAVDITDKLDIRDGYMIIAGGGAVARPDGTILKDWRLTRAQAEEIYAIMREEDVMMTAFTPNAVYRLRTERCQRGVGRGLTDYLGGRYLMSNDDPARFEALGLERPYKMEAYAGDMDALPRLRQRFTALGYTVCSAYADNLEILAPGCGKGTALTWLAGHLGIPTEEIMAFGDNTNDIQLLEAVGWPVAVGNAVDELKARARIIAEDCDRDGVAILMERAMEGKLL